MNYVVHKFTYFIGMSLWWYYSHDSFVGTPLVAGSNDKPEWKTNKCQHTWENLNQTEYT